MGGVTSSVASKFAFFPPSPPTYSLAANASKAQTVLTGVEQRENVDVLKLCTRRGTEIVAMYVRQPSARLTIPYSHGNAADLGQMFGILADLSSHLHVNLMGSEAMDLPVKFHSRPNQTETSHPWFVNRLMS